MDMLRDLFEETVLDHNRHPRHFMERPEGTNHQAYGFNPLCGDEFWLHLAVDEEGVIREAGFDGVGCAISVATVSLMVEHLPGLTVARAEALFETMRGFLVGDRAELPPGHETLALLAGVRAFPTRIKCATLGWHVLHAALGNAPETVCTE